METIRPYCDAMDLAYDHVARRISEALRRHG